MREACKFNVQIHNANILMSSVTKDPGVSSILLFSGSGINFPRPLKCKPTGKIQEKECCEVVPKLEKHIFYSLLPIRIRFSADPHPGFYLQKILQIRIQTQGTNQCGSMLTRIWILFRLCRLKKVNFKI